MNKVPGRAMVVLVAWVVCGSARAQDPDWGGMSFTQHSAYQVVDADGNGTFPTDHPIKMRGVILNRPGDMLNATPGSDPFMGGQWQQCIQSVDGGDFGGTAMWIGPEYRQDSRRASGHQLQRRRMAGGTGSPRS